MSNSIEEAEAILRAIPPMQTEVVKAQREMLQELSGATNKLTPGVHTLNGDLAEFNRAWSALMKECFLALMKVAHRIAKFGAIE